MGVGRSDFGITYDDLNIEVYVFGGVGEDALSECEKYSVKNDQWTKLRSMNKNKSDASASIVNNQFIFVIGGCDIGYKSLNDIEKYSIEFDSWETIHI